MRPDTNKIKSFGCGCLVLGFVFLMGVGVGGAGKTTEKETIKEVEVIKEVPMTSCNYENWLALSKVDNKLQILYSDILGHTAEMFGAVSELDLDRFSKLQKDLAKFKPRQDALNEEKAKIIRTIQKQLLEEGSDTVIIN